MSLLTKLQSVVNETRRRTLGAALDALAERRVKRDEAAFSIALIALSAKMAKADGVVTDDEIAAFRDFFDFDDQDGERVRMLYSLAQQDVAGFDHYLARVARIYEQEPAVLEDVLDCLFHIAAADGVAHPRELEMLETAAKAFGVTDAGLRQIKAVHLGVGDDDPYAVLGVTADMSFSEIRRAYLQIAKDHHPDALIARGVPANLVKIAEVRLAAANDAFARIESERERD